MKPTGKFLHHRCPSGKSLFAAFPIEMAEFSCELSEIGLHL